MNEVNPYVSQLVYLTKDIVERLDRVEYEELALFSDKREDIVHKIEALKTHLSSENKLELRNLCQFDQAILSRMNHLKQEAGDWLLRQGTIKVQKSAYQADYAPESMFFDSKK
ncbi:hypothetical protein GRF59_23685 [Paenibacillus sp. HJL G12]|uniref:Flagellar protein FliT n=1 Tax=Paenibacillus dendrobii TaxID=2691084 RepID=A0A7X3IME3_9BACL|nr:hypothetical protein [Paenibacillus dendrobii]MWV46614.1 hypothetical protein [Paenibacillus dendrobii]